MEHFRELEQELRPMGWHVENEHSFVTDLYLYGINQEDEIYQFNITILGVINNNINVEIIEEQEETLIVNNIHVEIIEEQEETLIVNDPVDLNTIDEILNNRHTCELSQSLACQSTINKFFYLTM